MWPGSGSGETLVLLLLSEFPGRASRRPTRWRGRVFDGSAFGGAFGVDVHAPLDDRAGDIAAGAATGQAAVSGEAAIPPVDHVGERVAWLEHLGRADHGRGAPPVAAQHLLD